MASTKAYPSWWADIEENKTLKRRKSLGEAVLERNICFVDTTGDDGHHGDPVLEYIEESFWHTEANEGLLDVELLNMVSGRGANLVDVVLFIFSDCKFSQIPTVGNFGLT
jgi:hypothetical protein